MANNYQQIVVIGRLGRDPEVRSTNSGSRIANISVGCTTGFGDYQHTEWFRCVIFGKAAEFVEDYCVKGDLVCVTGEMRTRKWEDNEGKERFSTELNVPPFGGSVTKLSKNEDSGDDRGSRGSRHRGDEPDDDRPSRGGRDESPRRGSGERDTSRSSTSRSGRTTERTPPPRRGPAHDDNGSRRARADTDLDDDIPF